MPEQSQTPLDILQKDIADIQRDMDKVRTDVRLSSLRDEVEDLDMEISGLSKRVDDLRSRGYAFGKAMETRAADLAQRWSTVRPTVMVQISSQGRQLEAELPGVESKLAHLAGISSNVALARPYCNQVRAEVDGLQGRAESVINSIKGMYDTLQSELGTFKQGLQEVDWMLKQLAEATFQLLPTEAGVMAVKTVWAPTGKEEKDDPEGVLFLTDQRILFEQKEEIATKKVLFITTEKKKVQELKFEFPVVLVEEVRTSKLGTFKNEDHLDLMLGSGAPYRSVHVHIWQDAARWQGLINRAKARDFEQDRAVAVDQAAVEKVKNAPTVCPACHAAITQTVLRGQDTIVCEYCGTVIRL